MDYKVFMVPALMVMLLTMLCGFMPALNIVAEKEAGTIEQINVTPVGKFTFILAKLIPYWSIGFFVLTLCFGLARLFYGLAPAGSIVTIYAAAGLFVLTISGFGLMISNHSDTMQQATFVMMFFMVILIPVSYTHLDVYKRQYPGCLRQSGAQYAAKRLQSLRDRGYPAVVEFREFLYQTERPAPNRRKPGQHLSLIHI